MTTSAQIDPVPVLAVSARRTASPPRRLAVGAVVVAALFAAPLVYLVVRTLGLGADAIDILKSDDALGPLTRTLTLAILVSVPCAVLGTTAAWSVTRTNLPFRAVWRVLLALPLVIPSYVGALALISAFSAGGLLEEVIGFSEPAARAGPWCIRGGAGVAQLPVRVLARGGAVLCAPAAT